MIVSSLRIFYKLNDIVHYPLCTLITNYLGGGHVLTPPFLIPQIMTLRPIKTGKKGGIVTYQVGDTILAREYNPRPANPKTQKQVAQRAKIKLLSQLGATFRDIIAIFPSSEKSARAIFANLNYKHLYFMDGEAKFNLTALQLTNDSFVIPNVQAEIRPLQPRFQVTTSFPEDPSPEVEVVFAYLFRKDINGNLIFLEYHYEEERKKEVDDGWFGMHWKSIKVDDHGNPQYDYIVYTFGMRYLTQEARDIWANEPYEPCELLGVLIRLGYITSIDFGFTETKAKTFYRNT